MAVRSLIATLLLASSVLAKTDIAGCTYTDIVVRPTNRPPSDAYGSRIWYVPGTGELCELLDCGGGRAPPKTNVPGCPLYSGTETYSPRYLSLPTKAADAGEATATGASGATVTGETQVTTKSATAPSTTLETSVSTTASETDSAAQTTAAPTTAAPVKSSASSSSTVTASQGLTTGAPGHNSTVTGAHPTSTFITNGAAPTGVAILGSCLIAGVAACVGML